MTEPCSYNRSCAKNGPGVFAIWRHNLGGLRLGLSDSERCYDILAAAPLRLATLPACGGVRLVVAPAG